MRKKRITAAATTLFTLGMCLTAFAGQWQLDSTGWWYDNGNGTWPASQWQWIDGNGDGVAECYYFDANGYCLIDTVTPDGYKVDGNGAWIENGTVPTKIIVSEKREGNLDELNAMTGRKATEVFRGDFLADGGEEIFAVYQYGMFAEDEMDSCQIWYSGAQGARQLFSWENTTGNSFCNVDSVMPYHFSDGKTYLIVNTWRRGAGSYNSSMIFGANAQNDFSMITEISGTVTGIKNGLLQVEESRMELNEDYSANYITSNYSAIIENGAWVELR